MSVLSPGGHPVWAATAQLCCSNTKAALDNTHTHTGMTVVHYNFGYGYCHLNYTSSCVAKYCPFDIPTHTHTEPFKKCENHSWLKGYTKTRSQLDFVGTL